MRRHAWLWGPALAAFIVGLVGIGVSATDGGRAAVDEPQYLLSALSLFEDGDLDISDELADRRWRDYHQADLPVQTEPMADGREVSPHDPLLPLLIAVPTGLFGWVGAKVAMSLLAAGCAMLLAWTAARRFRVPPAVAGTGSALAFASPPLGVYAQQVYPELPAALATLAAVAVLTAPRLRRQHAGWVLVAIIALPWLGIKYIPVAVALTALLAVLLRRRGGWVPVLQASIVLALAGVAYLAVHQVVWGGWTVYASGDHFQAAGELSVVGVSPDYVGRSLRLVGLLADRHYGLVPWQPAWLLLVPAAAALLVRRPRRDSLGWLALLAPLAAGWATATWLALTAHGFWWPGRQVVVVLPLAAVAIMWLVTRPLPRLVTPALVLAATGVVGMVALLWQGSRGRLEWVVDHTNALAPAYQLLKPVTPDYSAEHFLVRHVAWALVLVGLAVTTVVALRRRGMAPIDHR
ncbi:MAG TPA: hypothetical protein VFJ14_17410 [Nocardioidaceae bacterium]|nr:hypothetical protein [Nocardioidaceae bacterium]